MVYVGRLFIIYICLLQIAILEFSQKGGESMPGPASLRIDSLLLLIHRDLVQLQQSHATRTCKCASC